jgi:membrane protein insertase Oxa1/YidC/SpoIIIJ
MMTVVFALLLLSLPSSLLLYVFGVLLVTTTQELFALRYSRRLMNRALLKAS